MSGNVPYVLGKVFLVLSKFSGYVLVLTLVMSFKISMSSWFNESENVTINRERRTSQSCFSSRLNFSKLQYFNCNFYT